MYLSLKFLGTVQAARFVCLLLPPKDLYQISVKAGGALLTPSLAQVYFCKVLLWVFFGLLPSCLLTADLLQWSATEGKYRTHSVIYDFWLKLISNFTRQRIFLREKRYLKEILNVNWLGWLTILFSALWEWGAGNVYLLALYLWKKVKIAGAQFLKTP